MCCDLHNFWNENHSLLSLGLPIGFIAPSLIDNLLSGTIKVGSADIFIPIPLQSWQAPKGLLNENNLGSKGGTVNPHIGQLECSL